MKHLPYRLCLLAELIHCSSDPPSDPKHESGGLIETEDLARLDPGLKVGRHSDRGYRYLPPTGYILALKRLVVQVTA